MEYSYKNGAGSIQTIGSIDYEKFFIKSAADPFYFEFNNKVTFYMKKYLEFQVKAQFIFTIWKIILIKKF